jgi:hypothetical protein
MGGNNNYYIRYDSISGNLVRFDYYFPYPCNSELALIKLNSNVGDSLGNYCKSGDSSNYLCTQIYDTTIFGISTKSKTFIYSKYFINGYLSIDCRFARNIGFYYFSRVTQANPPGATTLIKMTGCRINGIARGDTLIHPESVNIDSGKYMPLAVGNKWVYIYGYSIGGPITYVISTSTITKDTIINNKRFFFIDKVPFWSVTNFWIRYDSTSAHLNYYTSGSPNCNFERILYDFNASLGDSSKNSGCVTFTNVCNVIRDSVLFGVNSRVKDYYYSQGLSNNKFAKNLGGLFFDSHGSDPPYGQNNFYAWLKGCVINGVLHGDTNSLITNILEGNNLLEKFSLSQNYPNPFNPTTKIRYSIPQLSSPHVLGGDPVLLKVYDILGKEVETLVNEKQSPGVYEVTFDGSKYASRIYFYTLTAGDFKETKKLVLLK